jgi:hypothetical protein
MMTRIVLLAVVSAATFSVTSPSSAQTPCYRPDGSMYVGVQRPADCSPVRPKARDEAIEQSVRDAAARPRTGVAETTYGSALGQDELNRRLLKTDRTRVDPARAENVLKECDVYKHRPSAMNAEQSAVCNRYWQYKATKALEDADR